VRETPSCDGQQIWIYAFVRGESL